MADGYTLIKEWSGYGFQLFYDLRKFAGSEDFRSKSNLGGTEFQPTMLKVNGQVTSDGSSWWECTANDMGRSSRFRASFDEEIPAEIPEWQTLFIRSALDRIEYEVGNSDKIPEVSLAFETCIVVPECVTGYQVVRSWTHPEKNSMLHTNVTVEAGQITAGYVLGESLNSGYFNKESAPAPGAGKAVDERLLWASAGYAGLLGPQIQEVLDNANIVPRNKDGFRSGKNELKLSLKDKAIGVALTGVYKALKI